MTGTRPPSPAATPTTIASSALPPRVRRVLQNLYDHIATDFIAALNAMLVEFEQQLFKQAEQARSNHLQAQVFVDLRALQKHRTELVPHYMFGLEAELAGIRTPRPAAETASALRLDYQTLTLVEDAVMDQEIVLREVARRHEQRGNAQILMLGQRFGVLARAPAYDADTLPLGPHRLCQVLASPTVGPEAISAGWSPGTSDSSRVMTRAGWQAAARRPPLMAERWRRTVFISPILAPLASKARLMACLSCKVMPGSGKGSRAEPPPEISASTTSSAVRPSARASMRWAACSPAASGTGWAACTTSMRWHGTW